MITMPLTQWHLLEIVEDEDLLCFWIDDDRKHHSIPKEQALLKIAENKYTVKFEGLEQFFPHDRPCTIHAYYSPENAVSFDEHSEPYDTMLYVLDGTKTLKVDGMSVTINRNAQYLIKANAKHYATNEHDSVMLSIGYENGTT